MFDQEERNQRTDLCIDCKPVDHWSCGMQAFCSCCLETFNAMKDDECR